MITYMQKLYATQSLHSMLLLKAPMRSFLMNFEEQSLKKKKKNFFLLATLCSLWDLSSLTRY